MSTCDEIPEDERKAKNWNRHEYIRTAFNNEWTLHGFLLAMKFRYIESQMEYRHDLDYDELFFGPMMHPDQIVDMAYRAGQRKGREEAEAEMKEKLKAMRAAMKELPDAEDDSG